MCAAAPFETPVAERRRPIVGKARDKCELSDADADKNSTALSPPTTVSYRAVELKLRWFDLLSNKSTQQIEPTELER